jgi:hypothetical protein
MLSAPEAPTPRANENSRDDRHTQSRQRGPLGEGLTLAETKPIRVHQSAGEWQVDYGSYVQGYHGSRSEAIETAAAAAERENRELMIERPRQIAYATHARRD